MVYPDYFTSGFEKDEYIFIVAPDPGYGQVYFFLYDFNNLPINTGYWANLGICCRSDWCPDTRRGLWIGGQVDWTDVEPNFGGGFKLSGVGLLAPIEHPDPFLYGVECTNIFSWGAGAATSLTFIGCYGAKCFEELEGESIIYTGAVGLGWKGPSGGGAKGCAFVSPLGAGAMAAFAKAKCDIVEYHTNR